MTVKVQLQDRSNKGVSTEKNEKLDLSGNTASTVLSEGSDESEKEEEKQQSCRRRARSSTHRTRDRSKTTVRTRDRSKTGKGRDRSQTGAERRPRDRSRCEKEREEKPMMDWSSGHDKARQGGDEKPMMDWSNGTLQKDSHSFRHDQKSPMRTTTATTTDGPRRKIPQRTRSRSLTAHSTRQTPRRTRSKSLTDRKAPIRTPSRVSALERPKRTTSHSPDDPLSLTSHSTTSHRRRPPGANRRRSASLDARPLFDLVRMQDKAIEKDKPNKDTQSMHSNRTTPRGLRRTMSTSQRGHRSRTRSRSTQRTNNSLRSNRTTALQDTLPLPSSLKPTGLGGGIMPLPSGYNVEDSSTRSSRSFLRGSDHERRSSSNNTTRRRHLQRQLSEARKLQVALDYCNNNHNRNTLTYDTESEDEHEDQQSAHDSDERSVQSDATSQVHDDGEQDPPTSTATKVYRRLKKTVTGSNKKKDKDKETGFVGPLAMLIG